MLLLKEDKKQLENTVTLGLRHNLPESVNDAIEQLNLICSKLYRKFTDQYNVDCLYLNKKETEQEEGQSIALFALPFIEDAMLERLKEIKYVKYLITYIVHKCADINNLQKIAASGLKRDIRNQINAKQTENCPITIRTRAHDWTGGIQTNYFTYKECRVQLTPQNTYVCPDCLNRVCINCKRHDCKIKTVDNPKLIQS